MESGNALGAFPQTPAPVLDKISGPVGAGFLSSTGLRSGNLIERESEILPSTSGLPLHNGNSLSASSANRFTKKESPCYLQYMVQRVT